MCLAFRTYIPMDNDTMTSWISLGCGRLLVVINSFYSIVEIWFFLLTWLILTNKMSIKLSHLLSATDFQSTMSNHVPWLALKRAGGFPWRLASSTSTMFLSYFTPFTPRISPRVLIFFLCLQAFINLRHDHPLKTRSDHSRSAHKTCSRNHKSKVYETHEHCILLVDS